MLISGLGLNAQSVGSSTIVYYNNYSLKFTVTSLEPAECRVTCNTKPDTPTAVAIPSSTTIEGSTFSVTSIGAYAFNNCNGLTSIEIPNSVTSIGASAFSSCSHLGSIVVSNENIVYDSRNSCNAIIETSTNTLLYGCKNTIIPNGVTSIGAKAFYNCELTSLEIPNSVTSIGNKAFTFCNNLKSIVVVGGNPNYDSRNSCNAIIETATNTLLYGCKNTIIPNTVTSIGNEAFYFCYGLKSLEIPNSVTSIGNEAFYFCNGLRSLEIPNSVTSIGTQAFYNCELTSLEIPNSVTSIGDEAFRSCSDLESIVVEEGNIVYDSRNNCNAIIETSTNTLHTGCKSTIVPNSVTSIGNNAFSGHYNLTSIELPNSITSIGDKAFINCYKLASLKCHAANVPETAATAFDNCPSDMAIQVPEESVEAYKMVEPWNNYDITKIYPYQKGDNITIDYEGYSLKYIITNLEPVECKVICSTQPTTEIAITIPSTVTIGETECNVTSIGKSAFGGCSSLTSIEIPNSITSIGNWAFYGCSSLTSIEIPSGVTSIGSCVFSDCSSLTGIEIPNSVSSIGSSAFSGCSSLTSIEIPNSVSLIEISAFDGCSNLTSIVIEEGNPVYDSRNNCNAIINTSANTLIIGCQNTNIPSSVTSIAHYAFYGCSSLTSIEIPSGVTSIGYSAFSNCSSLTSVEIPSSVTSIGNNAFFSCSSLTSLVVEEGNPVYDSRNNCNAIIETSTNTLIIGCQNTNIPNGVTSIGTKAFYSCSGLTSLEIPSSVTSIGNIAFADCDGLTSIVVEEGNPVYDSRNNCNAIIETSTNTLIIGCQNTNIPSSVTSIAHYAFYGCSSLTSIEIPSGVTSIGYCVFSDCSSLTSINCYAENIPETNEMAFSNCPSDMTIKVPSVSLDAYQATTPWNNYNLTTGLDFDIDVISNIENSGVVEGAGIYTDGETVTLKAIPNEGYSFAYWTDGCEVLSSNREYSFTATSERVITANFLTPNHWNPSETLYANNMTVIAEVMIDGNKLSKRDIIFKLYDTYGDGWNGASLTLLYSDGTESQNMIFTSGRELIKRITIDHNTHVNISFNGGNYDYECSFVIEYEDGELIYQSNGTPTSGSVCEFDTHIYIPTNIEFGAFCGDEIRGSSRAQYIEKPIDKYEFFLMLYGNNNDNITFKLYDHETESVMDLVTQEKVTFEVNGTEGSVNLPKVFNFTYRVPISVSVDIAEAGIISGEGNYHIGETVTLTATANEGFAFKNWTLNGDVVSEESEYTFMVTEAVNYVANFYYVQKRQLNEGWNWYSTYIDVSGSEGLRMLEAGVSNKGLQIKNQSEFISNTDGVWYGTLNSINITDMFMIQMSDSHTIEITGDLAKPSETAIILGTNWKWISYPVSQEMSVSEALSNITPHNGDYIKSQLGFSQYYEGLGWLGSLETMKPGQGYMYQNTSGEAKTLYYPNTSSKKELKANITTDNNYWLPKVTKHPTNMSVIAVVETEDYNVSNYEVGAFCNGECRGSARPIYIEKLDRHLIFLTVYGVGNETIDFRYYDINNEEEYVLANTLTFGVDAIVGDIMNPYIINFVPTNVNEISDSKIYIYPNPVNTNTEINLAAECDRIEIYNTLGVKVAEYENTDHIDGIENAGVYIIRITNKGVILYDRIIVR